MASRRYADAYTPPASTHGGLDLQRWRADRDKFDARRREAVRDAREQFVHCACEGLSRRDMVRAVTGSAPYAEPSQERTVAILADALILLRMSS